MESELPTCEFGYGKYLIVPFWYASAAYQARLVSPWVILARLRLAKIRTMARPNSPDMPPKRTKKVRLVIRNVRLNIAVLFLTCFACCACDVLSFRSAKVRFWTSHHFESIIVLLNNICNSTDHQIDDFKIFALWLHGKWPQNDIRCVNYTYDSCNKLPPSLPRTKMSSLLGSSLLRWRWLGVTSTLIIQLSAGFPASCTAYIRL